MRRITSRAPIVALLLIVSVIAAGCMSKAKKHLYKAEDLFEKKNYEAAREQLLQAIKLDPNLLDAHKALANIDEQFLHNDDEAAREYQIASALDPTDPKLLQKARYYRYLKEQEEQGDKALAEVKAGDIDQGMKDLRAALLATKTKGTRAHVTADVNDAIPIIAAQGDKLAQEKKYVDAVKTYEQAIRGYILMAEAANQQKIAPEADKLLQAINDAANSAGAPDMTSGVLQDVLSVDANNKVANMELAKVYLRRKPPDYETAAELMDRAGAPQAEVAKLHQEAKRQEAKMRRRR
jgi:tetratricopeptide (TPR) repeat protein